MRQMLGAACCAAVLLWPAAASADAVITSGNGTVTIGVFNFGSIGAMGVGINFEGVGDGIIPGCLCEGWGVSTGGSPGFVYAGSPSAGIGLTSFTSTATSATSVTTFGDLQITQAYGSSDSGALIENAVTLTNTGSGALTDVRYARNMDWDIPPTTFAELVTIQGLPADDVLYTSDDGFAVPNPLTTPGGICAPTSSNFVDNGPCDHGAWFSFGFGTLAPGESHTFSIFYGAAASEALALAALGTVGAEIYSFGQSNGNGATGVPATYIFGFAGVGGTPLPPPDDGAGPGPGPGPGGVVPEPASLLLLGSGLAGIATRRWRRVNR